MLFDHKYLKEYNNNNKLNQKLYSLNNISTDFSKTIKIVNNNYINQRNVHTNSNIHNTNNNYLYDKKLFKNTKLYNVIKPSKYFKNRNNSNSALHNNFMESSLTEGNFNNNSKKFVSIFHSHTFKINNNNLKLLKNQYNNINNLKIKKTNTHINTLLQNSNSFKLLTKSKSNAVFTKQPHYKNIIIHARDKNNLNNKNKIVSTIGISNNLSMKNIKNYSGFSRNNKQILLHSNTNNISNNNKLSDSMPKKSGDIREKIKGLKKEIENYKKEISNKDEIIKKQELKINKLNTDYENSQKVLENIQKKYDDLKKEYNVMKNNYKILKGKIVESEKNINFMKKKEMKLMQVLYLMKEKGVDINIFLNEVNQVTFHEITNSSQSGIKNQKNEEDNNDNNLIIKNIEDESGMSDITVYFPDKIKMNNIMETKCGQNIPKLNFGYVPEYSSDSDSGQTQKNSNIYNPQIDNLFFPKFNKFQNSA